jgi:hypothetical protein
VRRELQGRDKPQWHGVKHIQASWIVCGSAFIATGTKEAGTLGAFLRRERIYSSMIASWRKQVGLADQTALAPKRRGPKMGWAANAASSVIVRCSVRAAAVP